MMSNRNGLNIVRFLDMGRFEKVLREIFIFIFNIRFMRFY